ncbi:protein BTG3-like isoform X2 [Hyla sarda]|nr:protein BTG3-like isoform X2 [Hyla sarda]XP_056399209.1 protein BTG3-like isoform X2 [Hyla sarda]XP_056399210.1 protein BTG3-like isoform X2 [Hyla sarda]XP_056399211.1 protein BTG3-like isoform X2 [Hyla sarda]XP_056399212.1 protein BTG3-like isoform X2 [Hyla sarda]XP_056399213.1 protein BTG3-like isoform X2 [Hyla sarda]XP_056399214.1 protein BTG3-like isoform X2 [Hyla sarda]
MHLEIEAAVNFLVKILSLRKTLKRGQLDALGENLMCLLWERYQGHWYPDMPFKGQAYRCIRINSWQYVDESLLQACGRSGIEYSKLPLPDEMTLWIDPFEVCGRFGEHTDYFTIATFEHMTVMEPIDYEEKATSDYSSEGPSSGAMSENSSDDEASGEKATTRLSPDEAIGLSSTDGTPVSELLASETTRDTGSDTDENVAQETKVLEENGSDQSSVLL